MEEKYFKLAKAIIAKDGNFSTKDIEESGFPFETFLQLSQVDNKVLIFNAKKILSLK